MKLFSFSIKNLYISKCLNEKKKRNKLPISKYSLSFPGSCPPSPSLPPVPPPPVPSSPPPPPPPGLPLAPSPIREPPLAVSSE